MGKNFPRICSLKEKPSCFGPTLKLIEKSFHYHSPYSFRTDFAPLISESNHHNCFILIDEKDKVLAHVGVKERTLKINEEAFTICMLGGIAVDEEHRGQGLFQTLFQDVLAEKRSDSAFFLLWSDQGSLYKKFGFHFCGGQYEQEKISGENDFKKVTLQQLPTAQQQQLKSLYESSFKKSYLSLERNDLDWKLLQEITSADLYIKEKDEKITDYLFLGKGMDLTGVVHEYGSQGQLINLLKDATRLGKVWSGIPCSEDAQELYQYLLAPGDTRLFASFVQSYTNSQIKIRDINLMKQEVYFDFNGETLGLEIEEFLRGIFGPGSFEELGELRPLFISGLDSI